MSKEIIKFNLSEKIWNVNFLNPDTLVIQLNDIKEFISRLLEYEDYKKKLAIDNPDKDIPQDMIDAHVRCCIDTRMKIKELSGDKLI